MTSRRVQKAAQAIREVVSMSILTDLKDPRIRDVTVTGVEVSGDLRHAKVYISVMGEETQHQLSLRGLQSSAGYLQKKISDQINTRYVPKLEFVLDIGAKRSIEIHQILDRVIKEQIPADEERAFGESWPSNDPKERPTLDDPQVGVKDNGPRGTPDDHA